MLAIWRAVASTSTKSAPWRPAGPAGAVLGRVIERLIWSAGWRRAGDLGGRGVDLDQAAPWRPAGPAGAVLGRVIERLIWSTGWRRAGDLASVAAA